MTKTKKIVISIVAAVLLLTLAAWFLVPRILVWIAIQGLGDVPAATVTTITEEMLEQADVGETKRIESNGLSLEIPADFRKKDTSVESLEIYFRETEDKKVSMLIMEPNDMSDLDFTKQGSLGTDSGVKMGADTVPKTFASMGLPIPDSSYNTYKCMHMMTKEHYSFWNLRQGLACYTMQTLRSAAFTTEEVSFVETDTLCCIVDSNHAQKSYYLEIYSKDDLNTVHTVLVKGDTEVAYAVLDSVEFVK